MKTQEAERPAIELPPGSYSRRDEPGTTLAAAPAGAVALANAGSLLQAITQAVSLNHIDMDKVERLFAMHQQVRAQEAESAFNDAMAGAQANILPIIRNRRNTHTNSTYADLAAINEQIVPIYTAEGLAVSFDTETKNKADPIPTGEYRTVAWVTHRQGHKRRYHIDLPLDDAGSQGKVNKTKVQAKGSTNAFGRRYLSLMIFNLSTNDDDDGNGGRKREAEKGAGQQQGAEQRQEEDRSGAPPAYPEEKFTKNFPDWEKRIKEGSTTADRLIAKVGSGYLLSDEQLRKIRAVKAPEKAS